MTRSALDIRHERSWGAAPEVASKVAEPGRSDRSDRPEGRPAPDAMAPADLERGLDVLGRDAAWASLAGSSYGGVILVGFAVALGAALGSVCACALNSWLHQLLPPGRARRPPAALCRG